MVCEKRRQGVLRDGMWWLTAPFPRTVGHGTGKIHAKHKDTKDYTRLPLQP
jgi:hypothetical protein